jgi:5-methylcytosine-specific restriction endonuclease McrA
MIRVCAEPRCGIDATPGRRHCPTHDPGPWPGRPPRSERYPPDWAKRRAVVLERDPICRLCGRAASVEVDHIEGLAGGHGLENLRGVCGPCHASRSGRQGQAARGYQVHR